MGLFMIIGALFAGFLIISLFFEMLSSSPKPAPRRIPTRRDPR